MCRRARRRLVQMSALNADPSGPSRYLRTKGAAEAIVKMSQPRLDDLFARASSSKPEDSSSTCSRGSRSCLRSFRSRRPMRASSPCMGDVAGCMARGIDGRSNARLSFDHAYDLCGPKIYALRELVRYVGEVSGAVRPIVPTRPAPGAPAGGCARASAGIADEPRQPGIDGEGQRV